MAEQMTKDTTVLSLKVISPEPKWIDIDGTGYELRSADHMGLKGQINLARMKTRIEAIQLEKGRTSEDFTEDEIEEIINLSTSLVEIILPTLPNELLQQLSLDHMGAIVSAFTAASGIKPPEPSEIEVQ